MLKQTFKIKGKLVYDPPRPRMKKSHRAQAGWLILTLDPELGSYYRYLLKKYTGYIVHGQAFDLHVTVINDRDANVSTHKLWKKYNGKLVEIEIGVEMEQNWKFFHLPVYSEELLNIRKELGLPEKKYPFHLTIGRA